MPKVRAFHSGDRGGGAGAVRRALLASLVCGLVALMLASPGVSSLARSRVDLGQLELGVVRAINTIRVENGLAPLEVSDALVRAAAAHCQQQITDGYFGHETATGLSFAQRIAYYYPPGQYAYYAAGENL